MENIRRTCDVHVVVLLDRSGSMETAKSDHEGGLQSFIQDQCRDQTDDARFTLIQFDSHNPCELVFDGVKFAENLKPVLTPRGGTPLLDAIGLAVAKAEETQSKNTIFMIITDGEENSSREFTKERIKQLITRKEQEGWAFLYLGANVDAFAEAGMMGVSPAMAMNYAAQSGAVRAMYVNCSKGTYKLRKARADYEVETPTSGGIMGSSALRDAYQFTDEEKAAMEGKK